MKVSAAFAAFPNEAAIIGRILAGYTDLELDLLNCVKSATGDFDSVLKAMHRTRGETQRLEVADALGRQIYRGLTLGTEFEMALGAVKYCMRIRNLYAHSVWWTNAQMLSFTNLEEIAKLNDAVHDLASAQVYRATVGHLEPQFAYFEYASHLLAWVSNEGNKRMGRPHVPALAKPAAVTPPLLYQP